MRAFTMKTATAPCSRAACVEGLRVALIAGCIAQAIFCLWNTIGMANIDGPDVHATPEGRFFSGRPRVIALR